jgi:hypothetical protein
VTTRTVSAEVWALERRLEAAEAVCWMFGFGPVNDGSNREKAAHLLWKRWHESQTKAMQKAAIKAWPESLIDEVAAQYDAHRAAMLARLGDLIEVEPA